MKYSVTTLARNIGLAGALAVGVIGLTAHAASAVEQTKTVYFIGHHDKAYYVDAAQVECNDILPNVNTQSEVLSVTPREQGEDGIVSAHDAVVIRCWY